MSMEVFFWIARDTTMLIFIHFRFRGENTTMELNNKKIAFLGDSITEGCGASAPENFFWNVVARETGAECYGYGIGGTRIAPQRTPSAEERWDKHFLSRVEEMIPDADVVVVFGGTNDFGHGDAPFGKTTDRRSDTFCGALRELIETLIVRYPSSELVLMTPMHRLNEKVNDYNEWGLRNDHCLRDYVDAILEIAADYGLPVLDLYRVSGIQPAIEAQREHYMPDGLHPNDAGNRRIADRLIGFLKTL